MYFIFIIFFITFNSKLDTLKEEDNISSYSDANCFDNLNELLEVPTIHESIINSLIEEARNEGITVLEDNKMTGNYNFSKTIIDF